MLRSYIHRRCALVLPLLLSALTLGARAQAIITTDRAADVTVEVSGRIRDSQGNGLQGANVELTMNPYYPAGEVGRVQAETDQAGEYELTGTGHPGAFRVQASISGYTIALREVSFVKQDRHYRYNFVVSRDPEGRLRPPNVIIR